MFYLFWGVVYILTSYTCAAPTFDQCKKEHITGIEFRYEIVWGFSLQREMHCIRSGASDSGAQVAAL